MLAKTGSSDMSGPSGPMKAEEEVAEVPPPPVGEEAQLPPVRPVQVHSSWPAVHCGVLEVMSEPSLSLPLLAPRKRPKAIRV